MKKPVFINPKIFQDNSFPSYETYIEKMIEYKLWESNENKRLKKKNELTLNQQLLMLFYLGVIDNITLNATKKANLLSFLLNQNEQNIRASLPKLTGFKNGLKTFDNLNIIHKKFIDLGLEEIAEIVSADIKTSSKYIKK